MRVIWIIPVLASILILGTLGTPYAFAQLCPVTGCVTDNLYVLDLDFDTVRQYTSAGAQINADFAPGLNAPRNIAFDSTGNLYVADFSPSQSIRQYTSAGVLLNPYFATGTPNPRAIAFDFTYPTIGGTNIPIDKTALLLAGVQSISMWMIPVVVAAIGIGVFVIKRRK